MRNYYQDYKNLYDNTKPIRGRAEDVRPIGQRRRDWERIEMDGDVVACRLYNTQVVRYYPDGRIGLRCDSWSTPLTADFIHAHSPWQCHKRHNKLWVLIYGESEHKFYPIPEKGELQFRLIGRYWVPVGDVVVQKKVVDKQKSKDARAPIKPFLAWAKAFLTMSDGWIMHETRKQVMGYTEGNMTYDNKHKTNAEVYEMMTSGDENKYLLAMCVMLENKFAIDRRFAESTTVRSTWGGKTHEYEVKWQDRQFQYKSLYNRVGTVIKSLEDIYRVVDAKVGSKTQVGII